MDMMLLWDGSDIYWRYNNESDWSPLLAAAQFPDFAEHFDSRVPPAIRGYSPPLLTALPEPGIVQIWSGLIARTAPGWSLLLRAPANLPGPGGMWFYEGIVDTDKWFGPMFVNLRLTRTHIPIRLRADFPMLLAQPVQHVACSDAVLSSIEIVPGLDGMQAREWDDYHTTIVLPNQDTDRDFGAYSVDVRKRARGRCPAGIQLR